MMMCNHRSTGSRADLLWTMSINCTAYARAAAGNSACVSGLHGCAALSTSAAGVPLVASPFACNSQARASGVGSPSWSLALMLAPARRRASVREVEMTAIW
jgi:hypothetical protein